MLNDKNAAERAVLEHALEVSDNLTEDNRDVAAYAEAYGYLAGVVRGIIGAPEVEEVEEPSDE